MKIPPVRYFAPGSIGETLELLAEWGDAAKILAGGQSLLPLLAFRLTYPEVLVDLRRLDGLRSIRHDPGVSVITVSALATQSQVGTAPSVASWCPLLHQGIPLIAHPPIRNRGTVGGSMAHGDGAAELPAIALCLGATMEVAGPHGTRVVGADDFFIDHYTTALAEDEVLLRISFPTSKEGDWYDIDEITAQPGDYARVGCAMHLRFARDGRVARSSIRAFGIAGRAVRLAQVERCLETLTLAELDTADTTGATHADLEESGDVTRIDEVDRYLLGRLVSRQLLRCRSALRGSM